MEHVASQDLFRAVAVASAGNAEGPIIEIRVGPQAPPVAITLKASSVSGTADVKLQFHTSEDGVNFDDYNDRPNVVASTLTERVNGPELWNEYPLTDFLNKFIQFKVTGVNANPADTLVSAKLLFREFV